MIDISGVVRHTQGSRRLGERNIGAAAVGADEESLFRIAQAQMTAAARFLADYMGARACEPAQHQKIERAGLTRANRFFSRDYVAAAIHYFRRIVFRGVVFFAPCLRRYS
jgi:hypothetical protein